MSSDLQNAVLTIARRIQKSGGRAMLVGGCVRDELQGNECKDMDLEVYGISADQIRQALSGLFELDQVGMSFGVLKVHHYDIDISLPRVENKTGSGHRGFLVETVPDLSFSEAAARRDFTVNAIMRDPLTGEYIDPWNGRRDLKNRILRHVSEHFTEDPLRVLRGMQFTARFGFDTAPETLQICESLSQDELPGERIGSEWEKMLTKGNHPSRGLDFLKKTKWLRFYPDLAILAPGKWEKTLCRLDKAAEMRTGDTARDQALMIGALCLDCADPEQAAERFCRQLKRSSAVTKTAGNLVMPWSLPETDGAIRRLSLRADGLDLLLKLAYCQAETPEQKAAMEKLRQRADQLGVLQTPPCPILLGRDLEKEGILPGPEMGKILHQCYEAQLDGFFSGREEAEEYLKKMLSR